MSLVMRATLEAISTAGDVRTHRGKLRQMIVRYYITHQYRHQVVGGGVPDAP
uniref:Uncharacterized protein n=1 Tax=Arundo donax TaxID=35708 RepID=A0A0A8ZWR5_ARUDO